MRSSAARQYDTAPSDVSSWIDMSMMDSFKYVSAPSTQAENDNILLHGHEDNVAETGGYPDHYELNPWQSSMKSRVMTMIANGQYGSAMDFIELQLSTLSDIGRADFLTAVEDAFSSLYEQGYDTEMKQFMSMMNDGLAEALEAIVSDLNGIADAFSLDNNTFDITGLSPDNEEISFVPEMVKVSIISAAEGKKRHLEDMMIGMPEHLTPHLG